MATIKQSDGYDRGNREASSIILENSGAYPAGLVEWARRWVANHPPKVRRWHGAPAVASVDTVAHEVGEQLTLGFEEAVA